MLYRVTLAALAMTITACTGDATSGSKKNPASPWGGDSPDDYDPNNEQYRDQGIQLVAYH